MVGNTKLLSIALHSLFCIVDFNHVLLNKEHARSFLHNIGVKFAENFIKVWLNKVEGWTEDNFVISFFKLYWVGSTDIIFAEKDVFVSLPISFVKSLVYQQLALQNDCSMALQGLFLL